MKIEIKTHVFDIPARLREIDHNYFVVFNTDNQKFEVHSRAQKGNTLCVTLPYDSLDARCIDLVLKTRIENLDKILAEIDEKNRKLEEAQLKNSLSIAKDKAFDMANYAIKKGTLLNYKEE